jgi:hypothetical protein
MVQREIMKLTNIIHWLALTAWVSVLVAAGVAAASAFHVLPDPDLGVRLDRFAAFDAAAHGRIAAGQVMEPIFTFGDMVQFAAAGAALITMALQFAWGGMPWRRPANTIRIVAIAAATGLLAVRAATLTPAMNHDLRAYWTAAERGDAEAAAPHYEAFSARHVTTRRYFDLTLAALLVGVGATAAAFSPSRPHRSTSNLDQPRLLRT